MRQQSLFKYTKEERAKLKKKRRERKRCKKLCPMITNLERELGQVTAEEAAQILCEEFNFGKAEVTFASGRAIDIEHIRATVAGHPVSAQDVGPLRFWGGPPNGEARLFLGTLLTFLFDRIMYHNIISGAYADLVGKSNDCC